MADLIELSREGETLDAVVWRVIGSDGVDLAAAVESVLDATPGLAGLGPILPAGTPITIPTTAAAPAFAPLVQLWD